jgi:hypothetical protein
LTSGRRAMPVPNPVLYRKSLVDQDMARKERRRQRPFPATL